MKLQVEIFFACLIGLILVQQGHCDTSDTTLAVPRWTCTCFASYQGNQSSVVESNCSRSCDCKQVGRSSSNRWTCLCSADRVPVVVADSHNANCFTACDCTSEGFHAEVKTSRRHLVSKFVVVTLLLCVILTTFAFLSLLICYVLRRGKFPSQQPPFLSDRYISCNSATTLISHRTSPVQEVTVDIGGPYMPSTGCIQKASFLFGRRSRTICGTIIRFSYSELECATDKFAGANIIGLGGSSYVYRGQLKDSRIVAIKRLKTEGRPHADSSFSREVELLSRLHHCHVVPLLGYCSEFQGRQLERLLVFEYMPNGNLRDCLDKGLRETMNWDTRVTIAIGAAKGLEYLHEAAAPKILHRDVKSTNILLDETWRAKITDLGMAKHMRAGDLASCSSSPTRMQGTFGYFAPEYAIIGRASFKSDVFSFGVLLLELITGRQPIHKSPNKGEESLVIWAAPRLQDSQRVISELPDPHLEGKFSEEEMQVMAYLAKECLLLDPDERPTMSEVVQILLTIAPDKSRRKLHGDIYQRSSMYNMGGRLDIERSHNQVESPVDVEAIPAGSSAPSPVQSDSEGSRCIGKSGTESDSISATCMEKLARLSSKASRQHAPDEETIDLSEPRFESFCVTNVNFS